MTTVQDLIINALDYEPSTSGHVTGTIAESETHGAISVDVYYDVGYLDDSKSVRIEAVEYIPLPTVTITPAGD